jgi:ribosomal protein S18 acetylase RimI-like enzyme
MVSQYEKKDLVARRIFLENEVAEIRLIQRDAPEFLSHYFDYEQWLDMALREVTKGKRIAYGVYKPMLNSNSRPQLRLVGSVILKEEVYGKTVELKGLFVARDSRGSGCGTELCNAVETLFSKRGYMVIKTYVPSNETRTIDFLLKRGYEVLVTKESTYKLGERICEMHKTLLPLYGGDSFDIYGIFSWLLENVYGFSSIEAKDSQNAITFSIAPKHPLGAKANGGKSFLNGILLVCDGEEFIDKDQLKKISEKNRGSDLVFVYGRSFTIEARREGRKMGIVLFDENLMRQNFGNFFANGLPEFRKADIGGIVVSIHPEYFKRLETNRSFTFFHGGSVGKYLLGNNKSLFFSVPSSECPDGGIRAYGDIVDIRYDSPNELWNKCKDKNSLFTEDEYRTFVGNKHTILAITVDRLKWISPINLEELKDIFGHEVQLEDVKNLYISKEMLNRFYEKKIEIKKPEFTAASKEKHLQDFLKGQLKITYIKLTEDANLHDLLVQIQNVHPNFTSHGPDHSLNIIHNLENIIPRKEWDNFSQLEIFLLLSSAWIHDVGMADFEGKIDYTNEAERKEKSKEFRENHYERARKYIMDVSNYQRLGLTPPLAELIGSISRAHDRAYDIKQLNKKWRIRGYEKYKEIRVQLLAALFRLADACDMGWQRAKEVLIMIYKIPKEYIESMPHTEGAKKISGVFPKGKSLVVYSFASPQNAEQEKWVEFLKNDLEQDFLSVESVLKDKENEIEIPYDEIRIESLEAKQPFSR